MLHTICEICLAGRDAETQEGQGRRRSHGNIAEGGVALLFPRQLTERRLFVQGSL